METCPICEKNVETLLPLGIQPFVFDPSEISNEFKEKDFGIYVIRVCRECHGDFQSAVRRWLKGNLRLPRTDPDEHNVPVRTEKGIAFVSRRVWEKHDAECTGCLEFPISVLAGGKTQGV